MYSKCSYIIFRISLLSLILSEKHDSRKLYVRVVLSTDIRHVRQLCRMSPGGSTKIVVISGLPGNHFLVWLLLEMLCTSANPAKEEDHQRDCFNCLASSHWDSTGGPATKLLSVHIEEAEMDWFQGTMNSSLSIEELLEETKEKNIVDLRKKRLERSGFEEWKIWKLLRIDWK